MVTTATGPVGGMPSVPLLGTRPDGGVMVSTPTGPVGGMLLESLLGTRPDGGVTVTTPTGPVGVEGVFLVGGARTK